MAGEWGQEVLLLSHLYGRKQITKVRADKQLRDLLTSTPSGENKSQNETAASQPHSLVVLKSCGAHHIFAASGHSWQDRTSLQTWL